MARSSSSSRWKHRQQSDPFVRKAQEEGWRSRAIYKLQELDAKDRLFRPGAVVVDLGAAPGSWCQFAAACVKPGGRVFAVDLLPIEPLDGVNIIQGDISDSVVLQQLQDTLAGDPVDLVMSDMAPNITGNRSVDQPRSIFLNELALDFADQALGQRGLFVTKLFQGTGFEAFLDAVRERFESVKVRKPKASRPGSREMYLVARKRRI